MLNNSQIAFLICSFSKDFRIDTYLWKKLLPRYVNLIRINQLVNKLYLFSECLLTNSPTIKENPKFLHILAVSLVVIYIMDLFVIYNCHLYSLNSKQDYSISRCQ